MNGGQWLRRALKALCSFFGDSASGLGILSIRSPTTLCELQIALSSHNMSALVSVIVPVKDCAPFLDEAFQSILSQTYRQLQVCIYDDGSKDASVDIINAWVTRFEAAGMQAVFTQRPESATTRGAAYARNRCIDSATGEYLCLLDADDVMLPARVELQLAIAKDRPNTLIGSKFVRIPEDATPRYSAWLNDMTQEELMTHRYRENTLLQPTFFMHRQVFQRAGPYEEGGPAEDLKFFYRHIDAGGDLYRVDEVLVQYRYRTDSISWSTPKDLLREIRVHWLQKQVLRQDKWRKFAIWNAGRDGRAFFRSLDPEIQANVEYFLDISPKLVGTFYNYHGDGAKGQSHQRLSDEEKAERKLRLKEQRRAMQGVKLKPHIVPVGSIVEESNNVEETEDGNPDPEATEQSDQTSDKKRKFAVVSDQRTVRAIPIIHYSQCKLPFISCVSMDRGGEFEANVASLNVIAGEDFFFFC